MTYDFSRFSGQSFERFAQALASEALNAGIQVYGMGPDGGRDASFNGPMPITTHGHNWSGYLVAQAKYCHSDTASDGFEWVKQSLEAEFTKFCDPKRNLRKPEYYLLITNARLSGGAANSDGKGSGGIDKIEQVFEDWKQRLGLLGWQVWHADKITSLLDTHSQVRTRYSAWVTAGDVFSEVLTKLGSEPTSNSIHRHVLRELRRDRDLKRKDAGQVTTKRLYLDDLFVDLPLQGWNPEFEYDLEHLPEPIDTDQIHDEDVYFYDEEEDSFVVRSILLRAADKLDPASTKLNRRRGPLPNRIVLMGGPGQGKSTVGQFIAQVCRAKLARDFHSATPEVQEAASAVLKRAESEGLPLSGPARYPLHVELPKFADRLAQSHPDHKPTLLSYAVDQISAGADSQITKSDMRALLRNHPWLVIFDGLDEVPPSSNRADLVECINSFWDEVNECNGDVLVVVTTRPQGYGDDLPRRNWEHWTLASLEAAHAMRFARRLAEFALSDETRRDQVISEIEHASHDSSTAPLMVSPLQVAILFSLVETKGSVPSDRWTLFQRHYELMRDRESSKGGAFGALIREYRSQVDQIHYDAGFILHARSENTGSANAYMTEHEFLQLATTQLTAEGHQKDTADFVASSLVKVATDRLVLLGCKTGGHIAFDVRSLQEFMAAARIMSSPEALIEERLREISNRTHWRHVMRIACSKVFGQPELRHLRNGVIGICDSIDIGDVSEADALVRTGAYLAADLLQDGVALRLPGMRRSLVRRANMLMELGPSAAVRLARFYDQDTAEVFRADVEKHLLESSGRTQKAALSLAIQIACIEGEIYWIELSLNYIATIEGVADLYRSIGTPKLPPQLKKALDEVIFEEGFVSAWAVYRNDEFPTMRGRAEYLQLESAKVIEGFLETTQHDVMVNTSDHRELGLIRLSPISRLPTDVSIVSNRTRWNWLFDVEAFVGEPTTENLARAVAACAKAQIPAVAIRRLPWPVALALEESELCGLDALIARIETGQLGTIDDWLGAEHRWLNEGVTLDDVDALQGGRLFPRDIALRGAPPGAVRRRQAKASFRGNFVSRAAVLCPGGLKARGLEIIEPLLDNKTQTRLDLLQAYFDGETPVRGVTRLKLARMIDALPLEFWDENIIKAADYLGKLIGPIRVGLRKPASHYIDLHLLNKDMRGLLSFAVPSARSALPERGLLRDVDLSPSYLDTAVTRFVLAALRIYLGGWNKEDIAGFVSAFSEVGSVSEHWISNLIISDDADGADVIALYVALFRLPSSASPSFEARLRLISGFLDKRVSSFGDTERCDSLGLPHIPIVP
ncbi:MAG: hypothetical protein ACI9LT_002870 [Pseudoalteromonas distincta]|jgi:hypothetical protein